MAVRLNVIVAACSNRGIGVNGTLPWKLSGDVLFFKTITCMTTDPAKQNAVVMGRKTWESIPARFRPLHGRINIIISSTLGVVANNVHVARSFDEAMQLLSHNVFAGQIEKSFVIGGSSIYKAAFESGLCERIYLTEILQNFNCDTFLPEFDQNIYERIHDPDIKADVQTDGTSGVQYQFIVYQKKQKEDVYESCQKEHVFISVAIDSNRGFGQHGSLPWSFKKEFDHFIKLISSTSSSDKKVAVIKGRKTWESTCSLEQSLPSVLNIIISKTLRLPVDNVHLIAKSFPEAMTAARQMVDRGTVEKIWILGGQNVYQDAIDSGICQRIYITRIQAAFECNVHFPLFEDQFDRLSCEIMEDDGVEMKLEVYERH